MSDLVGNHVGFLMAQLNYFHYHKMPINLIHNYFQTNYSVKKALKNKAFSAYVDSGPSRGLGRGIGRGGRGRGRARGRIGGRPRDQKIQDSVVNLQDPKINVCGRIRGRAPHIDIFGKAGKLITSFSFFVCVCMWLV